jgi:hypothetical protein
MQSLIFRLLGYSTALAVTFVTGWHFGEHEADARASVAQLQSEAQIASMSMELERQLLAWDVANRNFQTLRTQQRKKTQEQVYAQSPCTHLPERFVSLWDSANKAEPPSPASLVDATPTGVGLAEVEDQHEHEAALYHQCVSQVKGWQQYWSEVSRLLGERK